MVYFHSANRTLVLYWFQFTTKHFNPVHSVYKMFCPILRQNTPILHIHKTTLWSPPPPPPQIINLPCPHKIHPIQARMTTKITHIQRTNKTDNNNNTSIDSLLVVEISSVLPNHHLQLVSIQQPPTYQTITDTLSEPAGVTCRCVSTYSYTKM